MLEPWAIEWLRRNRQVPENRPQIPAPPPPEPREEEKKDRTEERIVVWLA